MEVKELVGKFDTAVSKDKYCKAEKKTPAKARSARVNEWGTREGCSGKQLYENMKKGVDAGVEEGYLSAPEPFVAKPGVKNYKWDLDKIDGEHFPIQAHHIIPKNHLPDQMVCTFLCKKYDEHPDVQLTGDSFYDTDHSNNGYCMPYATPTEEWKRAKDDNEKKAVAYRVMEKTGRQLHQGSHRVDPYPDPVEAHEDDGAGGDDDSMHVEGIGYLAQVTELLKAVQTRAQLHATTCNDCKKNVKGGKIQLDPIDSVVHHVDQVSGIVKLLLDANRIFVSELAHDLWNTDPKTLVKPDWLKA